MNDREEPKKSRKAEKKLREETEFAASQTPAKPKSSAVVSSTYSIDASLSSSSDKTKKKGTVANVEPATSENSEKEGEADPSQDLEVDRDGADQSDSDQTTGQGVGRLRKIIMSSRAPLRRGSEMNPLILRNLMLH